MEKIDKLERLFDRFGYGESYKLGFAFYLGGALLVGLKRQSMAEILECQRQLAVFDINAEYEALLGPLRDQVIQDFFEEMVWRANADIQPREFRNSMLTVPLTEFRFENKGLLRDDDQRVETMGDYDAATCRLFEGVGKILADAGFDLLRAYKSGMCFFNLKAQVDPNATQKITRLISSAFAPIPKAIELFARNLNYSFDEYTNTQVALLHFIQHLDEEFGRLLWAYQSWVFYRNGELLAGVAELELPDFMLKCRGDAFGFLEKHMEAVYLISKKGVHHDMLPALDPRYDERDAILDVISSIWGYPKLDTPSDTMTSKAIAIFAYFCSMCETMRFAQLKHPKN